MFKILLTMHIAGAVVSGAALISGVVIASRRKGDSTKLKYTLISIFSFDIATGLVLVLLRPSTSSLTTFCISGTTILVMFLSVYSLANKRIHLSTRT